MMVSEEFRDAVIATAKNHQPIATHRIWDVIPERYLREWDDDAVRAILRNAGFTGTSVRKHGMGWIEWSIKK